MGMSPDEILLHYPSINLSDIYAALAYYYDHREEIRNQIEDDEIFALEMKKTTVSLVQQKLKNHYERQN
jgi:tryptophanyl-tRNA synthetase